MRLTLRAHFQTLVSFLKTAPGMVLAFLLMLAATSQPAGAQDIAGLTSTAGSSMGTVQTAVFTILGTLLAVALGILAYKLLKKPSS